MARRASCCGVALCSDDCHRYWWIKSTKLAHLAGLGSTPALVWVTHPAAPQHASWLQAQLAWANSCLPAEAPTVQVTDAAAEQQRSRHRTEGAGAVQLAGVLDPAELPHSATPPITPRATEGTEQNSVQRQNSAQRHADAGQQHSQETRGGVPAC